MAWNQLVRRMEGERFDRARHRGPVLRSTVHARAKPGSHSLARRENGFLFSWKPFSRGTVISPFSPHVFLRAACYTSFCSSTILPSMAEVLLQAEPYAFAQGRKHGSEEYQSSRRSRDRCGGSRGRVATPRCRRSDQADGEGRAESAAD